MSDQCGPCKELGLETPAHYSGTPASRSSSGKEIPGKCRWHYFGMPLPASMRAKIPVKAVLSADVAQVPNSLAASADTGKEHSVCNRERAGLGELPSAESAVEVETETRVKTMEPRICGREGCGKELMEKNTTGFCSKHFYDSKRKKPAGGSSGEPTAKPARRKSKPSPSRSRTTSAGMVAVQIPASHLDDWWRELPVEEKAEIYSQQFEG